jgi:hypothetical protein
MQAINIGPLAFADDKIAAVVAIGVFLVTVSLLEKCIDPRLGRWPVGL